eukprot:9042903-Alexandrium_andersonii.AAC.1
MARDPQAGRSRRGPAGHAQDETTEPPQHDPRCRSSPREAPMAGGQQAPHPPGGGHPVAQAHGPVAQGPGC